MSLENRAVRRVLNALALLLIVTSLAELGLVMFEVPGAGGWLLLVAFFSFVVGAGIRLMLTGS